MINKFLYSASKALLRNKDMKRRGDIILFLLGVSFLWVVVRVVQMQVVDVEYNRERGEARLVQKQLRPALRGRILDRNGKLLAGSIPAVDIWARPEDMAREKDKSFSEKTKNQLREVAFLLNESLDDLLSQLNNIDSTYVPLGRAAHVNFSKKIDALKIQGIYHDNVYKREYPEGLATSDLLGFVDIPKGEKGMEGLENYFNKKLTGQNGYRKIIRDTKRRIVETQVEEGPIDGEDIHLSIDYRLQSFAWKILCEAVEEHHAKEGGSVVVLDIRTGELLALVNCLGYNLNSPVNKSQLPSNIWRNRAVTDVFDPGSTLKPFTVGMALEFGYVRRDTEVDTTPGYLEITDGSRKKKVRDTRNFGVLTVEGVIQKSSNVGAIKISRRMTAKEMWETYVKLGYGQTSHIEFPGAVSGILRHWERWKPINKDTISYGYGISTSLLQLARSYTAFGQQGKVLPVTLLKIDKVPEGEAVFSPETAAQVRRMLQMATGPNGTGQRAQIEGYTIGGKSGTARKLEGKVYSENKYRSWFAGLAPVDDPRVIVAVMIDEPSAGQFYGGVVAAPVFSKVAQQALHLLGVPPDVSVKPQINAHSLLEPVEGEL